MLIKKYVGYLRTYIKNPKKIIGFLGYKGMLNWMSDKTYLKLMYKISIGKKLDLKNPKTFNEKLQWLKLNDRKDLYTKLVDKYEIREYIAETIGEKYLIPLIGVWDSVEEIDFSTLPNQFVLKCTHDSGSVFICNDKSNFNVEEVKRKIKKALNKNFYYVAREWPYKNIKPRIVCEKFISDKNTTPDDYKVMCFNGKAKLIEVHMDRFGNHKQDFYDEKWNKTMISQEGTTSQLVYDKPNEFDNMIKLSEKLAAGMLHVRVDWFIVHNKLYFGEMTFYDAAGFEPFDKEEHDYLLGSWIDLPMNKICEK